MSAAPAVPLKSPEAFRTISEVAADLDVPQHVLRFWETRFAQIRPVKRAGARRYYRPEDVDLLRGIRTLLYSDGYTIKGVQKILREQGIRYVAEAGRQPSRSRPRSGISVDSPNEPRYARAAIARVRQAHGDKTEMPAGVALHRAVRARLERLLKDLVEMKARLRMARERLAA